MACCHTRRRLRLPGISLAFMPNPWPGVYGDRAVGSVTLGMPCARRHSAERTPACTSCGGASGSRAGFRPAVAMGVAAGVLHGVRHRLRDILEAAAVGVDLAARGEHRIGVAGNAVLADALGCRVQRGGPPRRWSYRRLACSPPGRCRWLRLGTAGGAELEPPQAATGSATATASATARLARRGPKSNLVHGPSSTWRAVTGAQHERDAATCRCYVLVTSAGAP